jgi:RNA-binding protein YlmH
VRAKLEELRRQGPAAACSLFLDTHQWSPLPANPSMRIAGGHPAAQFRRVGLEAVPEVHVQRVIEMPEEVRSARQLRLWLYRAGLPEGAVGDVVVASSQAWLVSALPELALAGLRAERVSCWAAPDVTPQKATVAANRLDAVVAAIFRVSRTEAQTAIKYGFIFLDFHAAAKQTQPLARGTQLVYRTKGRAEIVSLNEHTRSGRLWAEYRLYPA